MVRRTCWRCRDHVRDFDPMAAMSGRVMIAEVGSTGQGGGRRDQRRYGDHDIATRGIVLRLRPSLRKRFPPRTCTRAAREDFDGRFTRHLRGVRASVFVKVFEASGS